MELSLNQRLIVPSTVVARSIAGESVLLNLDTETYFGLDAVATRMWTLLTGCNTVRDAYVTLLEEFDVEAGQLSADLTNFIEDLVAYGVVELGDA